MLFMVRQDTECVHQLAEDLETIGVMADELLDLKLPGLGLVKTRALTDGEVLDQLAQLRGFVGKIRGLELGIAAKLERTRERARKAARADWRLRSVLMLFTSGTQAFCDHIASDVAEARGGFDGLAQPVPYLRGRGLLSERTPHFDGADDLYVTDGFKLMGVLPLRELLARCEATLNVLDAHYDLFEEADEASEEETPSQTAEPTEAAEPVVPAPEPIAAEAPQPPEAEIAAAVAASEASLQSLTERLAEMKAAEPEAKAPPDAKDESAA